MGGSKVSDKIGVIDHMLSLADHIIIGGGMSYTFTAARGGKIGTSLCETESFGYCLELLKKAEEQGVKIHLPVDTVAADHFAADAEPVLFDEGQIPDNMMGLDIGPKTREIYADLIKNAGTVIWNGPMGVFRVPRICCRYPGRCKGHGREPCRYHCGRRRFRGSRRADGLYRQITHVSTGGGASLEFFAGAELPGVAALLDA